jgi:hypothetical protein
MLHRICVLTNWRLTTLVIMVSFDQRIVLHPDTQFLISMFTLVFFLLAVAFAFVGFMIYQLSMAIRTQNEILAMRNRTQAKRVEGKKE